MNYEELREIVERAADYTLPCITEEFHLDMFTRALLANSVTVQKKGEWELRTYGWVNFYYCPFCDTARAFDDWNFCPNCGADMTKGGAEHETD